MNVAVIPARGGSKRIPRKNIKPFLGRPVIAYTIEAAQQTGLFDKIIVSTDDDEIAQVAEELGAEVPFRRPHELSDDYTTTATVISHAVDWLEAKGEKSDAVCCMYAASPLVLAADVSRAFDLLTRHECDFVLPVTCFPFPIQRAVRLTLEGRMQMFDPSAFPKRSQDLEEAYHDAGQFYWGRPAAWKEQRSIFGDRSIPLILPRSRVQDIDTPEDWAIAETMFETLRSKLVE